MKVLFITQTFFPSYSGGTETYLLNVALELANRGISSLILCTNSNEKDGLYSYKGIPVQNVGKELNLFKEVDHKFAVLTILSAVNWINQWYKPKGKMKPDEAVELKALFVKD